MAALLVSCDRGGNKDQAAGDGQPVTEGQVVEHYAKLVSATYGDALSRAREMQEDIETFLSGPTAELLEKARDSWTAARIPYLQTEVFRFYEVPLTMRMGLRACSMPGQWTKPTLTT